MEIGKGTRDTWNNDDTDHGQGTRRNMTEQDSRNNRYRPNILSSQQRMCQTKTNVQTLESPTRNKIDLEFCFIKFYLDNVVMCLLCKLSNE